MAKKIIQRVIIVIFAILLVLAATVTIMYFHRSSPDDVIKYDKRCGNFAGKHPDGFPRVC